MWASCRPQEHRDVYGGLLEYTVDSLAPPVAHYLELYPAIVGYEGYVTAEVHDEHDDVVSVTLDWMVNGIPQNDKAMSDDGNQGDGDPSDDVYGASIGSGHQIGDTISVRIEAVDGDNNYYYSPYQGGYWDKEIRGYHSNNKLWTVLDESYGTIGAYDRSYPSFEWPGGSYDNYLSEGNIQVGYFVDSTHVLVSEYLAYFGWQDFDVSAFSWSPFGDTITSDYQLRAKSGEVEIERKGYSFSKPSWSEFLIFDYWVKNTSSQPIDSLYVGWMYDIDIEPPPRIESSANDWVGYDSTRNLPYMYSSDDSGWVGMMLLKSESPTPNLGFHWWDRWHDPRSSEELYQILSDMSISETPLDSSDYRIHLSTGPFTLYPGDSLNFRIGAVIGNGLDKLQENADSLPVGVEHNESFSLLKNFSLFQNYPNPFNPITVIRYSLPKHSHVTLEIYNILGQKVATLVDGKQKAGYKTVRWNAGSFSSGIYFYRLQAGDFVETRKMMLLK